MRTRLIFVLLATVLLVACTPDMRNTYYTGAAFECAKLNYSTDDCVKLMRVFVERQSYEKLQKKPESAEDAFNLGGLDFCLAVPIPLDDCRKNIDDTAKNKIFLTVSPQSFPVLSTPTSQ